MNWGYNLFPFLRALLLNFDGGERTIILSVADSDINENSDSESDGK